MATELINGVYHVTFRENGGGGGGGGTDPNAVHFTPQTLTGAQKAQALKNIGATSSASDITYPALVALRTGGNLVPGQYYRITDYVTTTADAESRSVGHLFDVIVLALDESHLSEEAFAAHHDGDTYFASSALDAWQIWYCLDNDTTRFTWADTTNGKGVIYRMIDEYDNDVPYDFKNIQFKRYEIASTTQSFLSPLVGLFIGRSGYTGITVDSSSYKWYYTFSKTGATWDEEVEDASFGGYTTKVVFAMKQLTNTMANKPRLLNNVFMYGPVVFDFLHTQAGDSGSYSPLTYFTGWKIDGCDCSKNTLVGWFGLNYSESTFRNNLIIAGFRHTTTGTNFEQNVFFIPHDFAFNRFGQACYQNVIVAKTVNEISTEAYFYQNIINASDKISTTTFGAEVCVNTFTNIVKITNSHFGNRVANNIFTNVEFGSVSIDGQFTNCSFSDKFTACTFNSICGYVDFVGGTNGAACVGLDVVGSVRGTTSSHITISSSNFILSSASDTNRRIRLEGATDGSIIATWKGTDGVPTGIRSTDNGATWAAYSPVPALSTNISADRNSDTKTATPKAVADYVDAQSIGVPVASAIPSGGMKANVHYALGTLTGNVSITIDSTSEVAGMMNIYSLSFVAGSTAPNITFPSSITGWAGNCLDSTTHEPVITAGEAYEFTLEGNLAVINKFEA